MTGWLWTELLFDRSSRVYRFGALAGVHRGLRFDPELLHADGPRVFYRSAGDAPGAMSLMSPDIEWITMWHYEVDGPGSVAEGLFRPLAAEWTNFSLVPGGFVTEDDTVVSLGEFEGVHGATARPAGRTMPTSGW